MSTEGQIEIAKAPAPWFLKGECYTFLCNGLDQAAHLPNGGDDSESDERGTYLGGPAGFMLVRYSSSPVGPYDELMYIPGRYKGPNKAKGFQITRIYVSSEASTLNGRLNWNIGKHVARFVFTPERPEPGQSFTVSIFNSEATEPFFSAVIRPPSVLLALALPATTSILGSFYSLIQPPLRKGQTPELAGTEVWKIVRPKLWGSVRKVTALPNLEGPAGDKRFGDGVSFPDIRPNWIGGVMMREAKFSFPAAVDVTVAH